MVSWTWVLIALFVGTGAGFFVASLFIASSGLGNTGECPGGACCTDPTRK